MERPAEAWSKGSGDAWVGDGASATMGDPRVKGMTVDEVTKIKNTEIANHSNLPPVKLHCGSMLAEAPSRQPSRQPSRTSRPRSRGRGPRFVAQAPVHTGLDRARARGPLFVPGGPELASALPRRGPAPLLLTGATTSLLYLPAGRPAMALTDAVHALLPRAAGICGGGRLPPAGTAPADTAIRRRGAEHASGGQPPIGF